MQYIDNLRNHLLSFVVVFMDAFILIKIQTRKQEFFLPGRFFFLLGLRKKGNRSHSVGIEFQLYITKTRELLNYSQYNCVVHLKMIKMVNFMFLSWNKSITIGTVWAFFFFKEAFYFYFPFFLERIIPLEWIWLKVSSFFWNKGSSTISQ